jgi:hypothetical protein
MFFFAPPHLLLRVDESAHVRGMHVVKNVKRRKTIKITKMAVF